MKPLILLAERWNRQCDPRGWWISEKLDGIRAVWDGSKFITREGNLLLAPARFRTGLPSYPLDGELYLGRKRFEELNGLLQRKHDPEAWREITYQVFDAPRHTDAVEQRWQMLSRLKLPPHVQLVEQVACAGQVHLADMLAHVTQQGGEGLMLRMPCSPYYVGRSATLQKLKDHQDAEAIVIGHIPGTKRNAGRLGSLLVVTPQGKRFQLGNGFSDNQRDNPPAIGATVTYRYQEITRNGIPRFASFLRVRFDH